MAKVYSIDECPPFPVVEGVEFRHIPSWLGYIAGSDGSIWSCIHKQNRKGQARKWNWKKLKQMTHPIGYKMVNLTNVVTDKKTTKLVHRIICATFHGPCPDGLECCHFDGTRDNNVPSNLRWDTSKNNAQDSIRHGTFVYGERSGRAKLSDTKVRNIRSLMKVMSRAEIVKRYAAEYGVDRTTIYDILNGTQWKETA